jgi:hypothetical protein
VDRKEAYLGPRCLWFIGQDEGIMEYVFHVGAVSSQQESKPQGFRRALLVQLAYPVAFSSVQGEVPFRGKRPHTR